MPRSFRVPPVDGDAFPLLAPVSPQARTDRRPASQHTPSTAETRSHTSDPVPGYTTLPWPCWTGTPSRARSTGLWRTVGSRRIRRSTASRLPRTVSRGFLHGVPVTAVHSPSSVARWMRKLRDAGRVNWHPPLLFRFRFGYCSPSASLPCADGATAHAGANRVRTVPRGAVDRVRTCRSGSLGAGLASPAHAVYLNHTRRRSFRADNRA